MDLRAATPSAAAELSLPDKEDLSRQVRSLTTRLGAAENTRIRRYRTQLDRLAASRVLTSPEGVYKLRRETVAGLEKRLSLSVSRHLGHKRQSMERVVAQLGALNPLAVLSRGYALVQDESGHVVPAVDRLTVGDTVNLRFSDGSARMRVEEIGEK